MATLVGRRSVRWPFPFVVPFVIPLPFMVIGP